jgi:peptidoglycan/xylan/chitin deacetylase (PgdA/CDA1 family)
MHFRLDRAATLMLFHPLARAMQRHCTSILMYHAVSEQDEPLSPYFVTNTKPAVFHDQMCFLAENGYRVVDLETALREKATDNRRIIITFDDGFRDFYTHAFPVLRKFGFTATMFVPTGLIHNERRSFKGRECMTWDEVRTLAESGIYFGSHTVSHSKLFDLDWPKIEEELSESKRHLEKELNCEIATFAYPFAYPQADVAFTGRFESLLKQLGYRCNVTTRIGRMETESDPHSLPRLPMNSFDDNRLLKAKLAGGYDWLAVPQAVTKKVRHWTSNSRTA